MRLNSAATSAISSVPRTSARALASPSPNRRTAALTTPSGRSVRAISQVAASSPSTNTSTTAARDDVLEQARALGDAVALAHHRVLVDGEHLVGALLDRGRTQASARE